jgi:hypothetical protein
MEPWKYRGIAAWAHYLGSQQYYIEAQQAKAARENAPLDALYRSDNAGGWVTISDLRERGHADLARGLERAIEAADLARGLGTNAG